MSLSKPFDSVLQHSFYKIRFCVLDKLADCFDPDIGNHWRHLACACGLDNATIENIGVKQGRRPTHAVFEYWKQKCPSATIDDFVTIAKQLERNDAIRVLKTAHQDGTLFHNLSNFTNQDDMHGSGSATSVPVSVTISVVKGPSPRPFAGREDTSINVPSQRLLSRGSGTAVNLPSEIYTPLEARNNPDPSQRSNDSFENNTHPPQENDNLKSLNQTRHDSYIVNDTAHSSQYAHNSQGQYAHNSHVANGSVCNILSQISLSDVDGPRTLHSYEHPDVQSCPQFAVSSHEMQGNIDNSNHGDLMQAQDQSHVYANDPRNFRRSISEQKTPQSDENYHGFSRPPNSGTWPKQNSRTLRRPQHMPWPGLKPQQCIPNNKLQPSPNRKWSTPQSNDESGSNMDRHPQSCPQITNTVESVPRPQPQAKSKVFVTYASDLMKSVMFRNLLENLTKNGFEVKLDMRRRDFREMAADRMGWLTSQFESCDFILVCCSPKYIEEAKLEDIPEDKNDHSLNTRYIATLMQTQHREKGSRYQRFIPVLMDNAKSCHVPIWLRNTIIYHWPREYQQLMGRLAHGSRQALRHSIGSAPTILQVSHKREYEM